MRIEDLTVADLMARKLVTVTETSTVADAEMEMYASDIRHLPVVDEEGRLVGILSSRDLYRALRSRARKPVTVGEVMTTDLLTVRPDNPAREATTLMLDHKVGSLPVVDDDGRLVGLVTETDFLRIAHRVLGGDRVSRDED